MDSGDLFSLVLLLFLLLCSAFFSASETAYTSVNILRIKSRAAAGDKRAEKVLALCSDYNKLLTTILIGNNIANITMASMASVLFVKAMGGAGVSVSTAVVTVVVLIFGEISPKSLSKEAPEKIALAFASPLTALTVIFTPINYLFSLWKKLLSRFFKPASDKGVTEEEIVSLIEEATQEGDIGKSEGELILSAVEFNVLTAEEILTPRTEIAAISDEAQDQEIRAAFIESGYSRLPVYHEDMDSIIGVIHLKDFFHSEKGGIGAIIKPVLFVTPGARISEVLKLMQAGQMQMAVVTDEYGGTEGIVTVEDVIEQLVGEIWDEHDAIVNEIAAVSQGVYTVMGTMNLDQFFKRFQIDKELDVMTVSGWVISRLGHIPVQGESFEEDGLRVTVTKEDPKKVQEICVEVIAAQPAEKIAQ